MELNRDELLMKLGAARAKGPAAWRLVEVEVASEGASFSYALMMSIRTIAEIAISDPLGSYLYGDVHLRLEQLVWINAGSTLAVLLFLPLLPVALMAGREGDVRPAT